MKRIYTKPVEKEEFSDKIIKHYEKKGLKIDSYYTPMELYRMQVIPSPRKPAAHYQFIYNEAKKGNLKAVLYPSVRPNYQYLKIKGEWVLKYLKERGFI